ncbi:MAG: hypothetical protein LUQ47_04240 [Methanotrichaceae archaeon]|nr:hypothetical protein [Methanotrichaceae archaeon]
MYSILRSNSTEKTNQNVSPIQPGPNQEATSTSSDPSALAKPLLSALGASLRAFLGIEDTVV